MKTVSNKVIIASIISSALLALSTLPVAAISDNASDNSQSGSGTGSSATCTRISSLKNTNESGVAAKITTMQNNFTSNKLKLTENTAEVNQKLATARAAIKSQFEEKIQTMLSQTGLTDAQAQAINTYKIDMDQAEIVRETAVDAARNEYQLALINMVQSQQQNLINAANSYQTTVQAAFNTANTNCSDNNSMSTLRSAVKTARQTLTTARETTQTMTTARQQTTTRNAAIKAANEAFAESVATYSATLTAALETTI